MSIFSEDNVPQHRPKGATHQELLLYKSLQALAAIANTAPAGPGIPPSAGLATVAKQDDIIAALAGIDTINSDIALDVHVDDLEQLSIDGNATLVLINSALATLNANITPKSNLYKLENEANDTVTAMTYLDAADNVNRRIETVILSSVALGISATKTMVYGGIAGGYYLTSVTLS